jgi:hypothetical protein
MAEDYVAVARRRWPDAAWIIGSGRFASVAFCREVTVMLFQTMAEAQTAKRLIDRIACGGRCVRNHVVLPITPADDPNAATTPLEGD